MNVFHTYDHYLKHDEITALLRFYEEKYPDFCRLTSMTKTEEGRDIWLMEITDRAAGSFEEKPAYVAAGNIHAGEVTGSMNVMYLIDVLLTGSGDDASIRQLLRDYTVYAIPRVSPDGAEFYLTTGGMCRSVNKLYPAKEMPPGIYGEDMDGDGAVRQMRIKDPLGMWKVSDEDERLMVHRAPDELEGEFYSVFREGRVHGNPAVHRFDAPDPYGNDFNRSFPINWAPDHIQPGAGPYPLYNLESRNIAEFLTERTNICALVMYHTCAGTGLYPPATMPLARAQKPDIERYEAIGRILTEETTYPAYNIYEQFSIGQGRQDHGAFDDFVHFGRGIFSMTIECWDLDIQAGLPGKWERPIMDEPPQLHYEYEKKMMAWVDEHLEKDTFKPWTVFQHPQLGEVEIGGYDIKYVMQNPPIPYLQKEMERCTRFMLRQIRTLPRIELADVKAVKKEDDVYEVSAVVQNLRFMPTSGTAEAVKMRILKEDTVSLRGADGADIEFVSGQPVMPVGYQQGTSGIHSANLFGEFVTMGPPLKRPLRWKNKARPGTEITVKAQSVRGGIAEETLVLPE